MKKRGTRRKNREGIGERTREGIITAVLAAPVSRPRTEQTARGHVAVKDSALISATSLLTGVGSAPPGFTDPAANFRRAGVCMAPGGIDVPKQVTGSK